ncbi:DUF7168 domain-containing protein [Pararhizobium gei]|uniref:DUF7168 domain-containing protein n=1 Tax=Pararhizobium gei TaxID=1395951 RepID=UPI0023DAC874|nr:DUF2786 domain-containing protein [Rhizobium gei]
MPERIKITSAMNRETLKKRIAALRSKTTARGCSEAEALAAAEKAAALMAEYKISDIDLEICDVSVASKTAGHSVRDKLWNVLTRCTNTVAMVMPDGNRWQREFIGCAPGPDVAGYLYVVLDRAIDREIQSFKEGAFYRQRRNRKTRTAAVRDFTVGLVARLSIRLHLLFASEISAPSQELAIAAREERYPTSVAVKNRPHDIRFSQAAISGSIAGDGIPLSHGMRDGTEPPRLIGGGR